MSDSVDPETDLAETGTPARGPTGAEARLGADDTDADLVALEGCPECGHPLTDFGDVILCDVCGYPR